MESNQASQKKYKFCYIMRGLPGSGKTTVAKQLAGENGKIFTLDKLIRENKVNQQEKPLNDFYEKMFNEFVSEIEKGTEVIVIDNTNLCEWEFVNFIKKAQKEHYFVSVVTMPVPQDFQTIKERSQFDVNDDELTQMLAKWEPFSPAKLTEKSHQMKEDTHYLSYSDRKQRRGSLHNQTSDVILEQNQEEDEDETKKQQEKQNQ